MSSPHFQRRQLDVTILLQLPSTNITFSSCDLLRYYGRLYFRYPEGSFFNTACNCSICTFVNYCHTLFSYRHPFHIVVILNSNNLLSQQKSILKKVFIKLLPFLKCRELPKNLIFNIGNPLKSNTSQNIVIN